MTNLDHDAAEVYWQAITVIESQSLLMQLRVADYPNMKPEDRRKTHKQFHKLAFPKTYDGESISIEELNSRLKAAMNG